jgi:hypothetical protein
MLTKSSLLFLVFCSVLCLSENSTEHKRGKDTSQVKLKVNNNSIFKITRDTVYVNVEGRLYHALLINDRYYTFYEVRDPMSTLPIRKFYIISKNGKIEKEINVPKEILKDTYPHLFYWHNSIIVNTEFYPKTFFLDTAKTEFVQNREIVNVPLFDNGDWEITSICHGEFGSTIYFKNKLTNATYTSNAGCPVVVNKLGDEYFANISGMPYNYIVQIPSTVPVVGSSMTVAKTIFQIDISSGFYIATSFVSKNILYHIYNFSHDQFSFDEKKERIVVTKDSVKIGTISNGVFKPVCTLKDKCHIELQQRLSADYQLCLFHTEDRIQIGFKKDIPPYMEAKYGVIEIKGDEIKIHYFFSKRIK